jgi:hypothetical protein
MMIPVEKRPMEKFDPSPHIKNSYKITDIFGYWPEFHDAEVLELRLTVADAEPWATGSESPAMEMLVHLFEMTGDVSPEGNFCLDKHTLVRLRFGNVEALQLANFWYQNCIFELEFGIEPVSQSRNGQSVESPRQNLLSVDIHSAVGLSGKFRCQSVEVVSTEPCDQNGKPLRSIG